MLAETEMIELEVRSMVPPGLGMGYYKERAVFIEKTAPGDRVKAEIVKASKNHVHARLVEVITPAPQRIEVACPHYLDCGGCNWMHLSYPDQLDLKKEMFQEVLQSQGLEQRVAILPSPLTRNYRNKATLKAGNGKLGLSRALSNQVIAIPECLAFSQGILDAMPRLSDLKEYQADFPLIESSINGQVAARKMVQGKEREIAGFPHCIIEDYGFGKMELAAANFAQANPQVTRLIVNDLVDAVKGAGVITEYYAGSGTLTLPMAQHCSTIIAFEVDKPAVKLGQRNSDRLDLNNIQWITVNAAKATVPEKTDWLVADPPRKGLEKNLIQQILQHRPPFIAYLSCNPASLSRDLGTLTKQGGYKIHSLQAYDMYVHSHHLEALALLRLG